MNVRSTLTRRGIRGMARIGAAAFAAALAATLVACSLGAAVPDPAPGPEAQASTLSGELTVYAAASLQPAFEQLAEMFNEAHQGVTFTFSFDGSSVLATQILSGAPVDVFASADEKNMLKVTGESMNEGEPVAFATSTLAIAVAPGNPFGITSLADLVKQGPSGQPPVTVICAAEVPCGTASRTLLERDGVTLTPASEEQNVTAVLTTVREGEADAGLVYYSDILRAGGEVEGVEIENAGDAAGLYLIVPVKGAANPEAAEAFSQFTASPEAQALLAKLGFGPAR